MVLKLSFQQLMNDSYVAVAFGTRAALWHRRMKMNSCEMSITPDLHIPVKLKNYHPARSRACVTFFLLANLEALCRCRPFSCQAHPKVLFCHRPLASTFDEDRVRHKTALIRRHLQPCRPRFWSIAITNYCRHCMDSHGCKLKLIVLIVLAILTLQNSIFSIIFLKPNPSEAPHKCSNMLLAVNMWTSHVSVIYYHLTLKICSNHVFSLLKKICALNNNFCQWLLPQTIKSTCTAPSKKYPEFMNMSGSLEPKGLTVRLEAWSFHNFLCRTVSCDWLASWTERNFQHMDVKTDLPVSNTCIILDY